MQLPIAQDVTTLQKMLIAASAQGKRISFVPTMGALHAGHASLIESARQFGDVVVVSIFVNPKQFGKNEDFSKYPRMLDADVQKVAAAGGAIVYAPTEQDMYPQGFSSSISVGHLGQILEGAHRPGHFDGVATVVAKLLLRILPQAALFGEKDYQQLCVIRKLVRELDMPINIVGMPTIRESDGLAMSSRNMYLSKEERALAPKIYETLMRISQYVTGSGGGDVKTVIAKEMDYLKAAGFKVDYVELRKAHTLEPMETLDGEGRLLVAAWLGNTRLIDNIAV
ncbi:MAG: pantoate--beta-alanine ligase [Alphaproteobacteria bacterium]